jgi:putative selenium metabolism hydrolase
MKEILELARKYEKEVSNFLVDIAKIESLSGGEGKVVERISAEMKKIGFDKVWVDGLGSVIGQIGTGKKKIAFDAHIDTVNVGNRSLWNFDPHDAHIKDGKIWGRGVADQKGGMASMVYAGKIIKELGLAKDSTVYMVGSVMEEDCDGLCWQHLIKEDGLKPNLVVLTEPTSLNIYRGHRGRMEIEVAVSGISCHGSAPERGVNAIYKMSKIVSGIEKLNDKLIKDDFLGKGTIVVSQISGNGPSQCAVADRCSIYIDRRLTWGETEETALREIREVAVDAGLGKIEISVPEYKNKAYTGKIYPTKKYYPTWKLEPNHEAIVRAEKVFTEVFAEKPRTDKWTFSTNGVAIMGMHQIPCIGFGPGNEEQAHAPNEWTPVEHLVKASAFYAAYVAAF